MKFSSTQQARISTKSTLAIVLIPLFCFLLLPGLPFASENHVSLNDPIPIKAGYFLEIYFNTNGFTLLDKNTEEWIDVGLWGTINTNKYSYKAYFDQAQNKMYFFIKGKFPSKSEILNGCEFTDRGVLNLLKKFGISENVNYSISAYDLKTGNIWNYKNGQLIFSSNPAEDGLKLIK